MKKENVCGIILVFLISFGLGYGSNRFLENIPETRMSALHYFEILHSDLFDNTMITITFHNLPKGYEYDLVYPVPGFSDYIEWIENDTFTQSKITIKVGKKTEEQSVYLIKLYKRNRFWDWCQIKIIDVEDLLRGIN